MNSYHVGYTILPTHKISVFVGESVNSGLDYWNGLLEWITGLDYWTDL